MKHLLAPQEIWEKVIDEQVNLEEEIILKRQEDDVIVERVYFNGAVRGLSKTRIHGVACYKPSKKPLTALLFVGITGEINLEELKTIARSGFYAFQIDYLGQNSQGLRTIYPECLSYCKKQLKNFGGDSVLNTAWYQYVINTQHAVSYLKERQEVSSITVVAIKDGADVALPIMAMDEDVSQGIVVLGDLNREFYFDEEDDKPQQVLYEIDADVLAETIEEDVHEQAWEMGMAPQSYLPLIKIPVLNVAATYDNGQTLYDKYKSFERFEKGCFSIIPQSYKCIPNKVWKGIVAWLKKPFQGNVNIEKTFLDGNLAFRVTTDRAKAKVQVWYCRTKEDKYDKYWAPAQMVEKDGELFGVCKLYNQESLVQAFAVTNEPLPISSPVVQEYVSESNVLPKQNVLYNGTENIFVPIHHHWHGEMPLLEKKKGPFKIEGMYGTHFATFAFVDDKTGLDEVSTFSFDLFSEVVQDVKLTVVGNDGVQYTYFAPVASGNLWQHQVVHVEDFKSSTGENFEAQPFSLFAVDAPLGVIITNFLVL